MAASGILKIVLLIGFCASAVYFSASYLTERKLTLIPGLTERLSKQHQGLCYTSSNVAEYLAPVATSGAVIVVWNSQPRLFDFLENVVKFVQPKETPLTVLTMTHDNISLEKGIRNVLNSNDCVESVIKNVIVSYDIRQVHFMYCVENLMGSEYVSYQLSRELFKCHTTLLEVLAKTFNSNFEAFFHLNIPAGGDITDPRRNKVQTAKVARNCTITIGFNAKNRLHVTIRILEMITDVFHSLYGFQYYFVL